MLVSTTNQPPYVPTNHPVYLPITLCTYQSPCVPTNHPMYLPVTLYMYLHTYLLQYLNQCLRTLTSLVLVQTPSGVQFLLTLLRPLLTHGLLSIPVSRSGSETSGDEVLSDREGATRRPGGLAGTGSDSDISDSEYSLSVDLKSR